MQSERGTHTRHVGRAAVAAIDGVFLSIEDLEGFSLECEQVTVIMAPLASHSGLYSRFDCAFTV